jgi:hypothetical protein
MAEGPGGPRCVGAGPSVEQTDHVQTSWRPRSNLSRALLPVVGGLVFFAVLALITWGIAALLSRNPEQVEERLAQTQFEVGGTEFLADLIVEDGPLLFQGLIGTDADRSIVLDHQGDDPSNGWRVRYAQPADRDESCKVNQIERTRQYTDCEGRTLEVDDLARPERARVLVSDVVIIDLRAVAETQEPSTVTDATSTTSGP